MIDVTFSQLWTGEPAPSSAPVRITARIEGAFLVAGASARLFDDPVPPTAPGRCPGLWNHEVCELFLVGRDERYLEEVLRVADAWRGVARIERAHLPAGLERWNAFAAHGQGADRRYLAASPVPGPRVDFHRIELFPVFPAVAGSSFDTREEADRNSGGGEGD